MIGALMDTELTLVHVGANGSDRLGRPTYGEVSRETVRGRLEQTSSDESAEYVANSFVAYLPGSVKLGANDRVEHEGRAFSVNGLPAHYSIPGAPAMSHVIAHLLYVGGEV